jgi:hypothetical protein
MHGSGRCQRGASEHLDDRGVVVPAQSGAAARQIELLGGGREGHRIAAGAGSSACRRSNPLTPTLASHRTTPSSASAVERPDLLRPARSGSSWGKAR